VKDRLPPLFHKSVHLSYPTPPTQVPRKPNDNEYCNEDSCIGKEPNDGMFHPVCNVCDGQHKHAGNQEVHDALLRKAPRIKLPYDGCHGKTSAHNGAQNRLKDYGIQLSSHRSRKLRCNRMEEPISN